MSSDPNEHQAATPAPEVATAATTEMKSTPSSSEAKLEPKTENNSENRIESKSDTKPDSKLETNSHKTAWERDTLERLAFATLAEQRANRRWRIFFRFAWLLLVVALIWTGTHRGGVGADPTQPHTAVVAIKGEIADGGEASAEWVLTALRSAFEDQGSQAVVLLINSPGGSPVQAGIINDEIRRLKEKHQKMKIKSLSG